MDCSEIKLILPEFTADRLNELDCDLVRKHIAFCKSCANALQDCTELFEIVVPEKKSVITPPDGYFDEVWPQLRTTIQKKGLSKAPFSKPKWLTMPLHSLKRAPYFAILTAAAVILAVVIMLYDNPAEKPVSDIMQPAIRAENDSEQNDNPVSGTTQSPPGITSVVNSGIQKLNLFTTAGVKGYLDPKKREDAYDSFTTYLANVIVNMQD